MNLIEAHKSGRRFKRQPEKDFYELDDMADARGLIPLEDAVADDYVLEPEAKLLTKDKVEEAVTYATYNMSRISREEAVDIGRLVVSLLFEEGK